MDTEGLDYDTQREKPILSEYGHEVQDIVDHVVSPTSKDERQRCVETIVVIMVQIFPQSCENGDVQWKVWSHLTIMSDFKLDIDYPYDISQAAKIYAKPEPSKYPMDRIPMRHYGNMVFGMFEKPKAMKPGDEHDKLARVTVNQMKRNLVQWGHGSSDDEEVAFDLEKFTDGRIVLDLDTFKFGRMDARPNEKKKKRRQAYGGICH